MKYLSLLACLLLAACGSSSGEAPAPPSTLGLETVPADQKIVELREVEDYNPDNNERVLEDLIVVSDLPAESLISSPYTVTGRARGTWFFEGSFPVILTDEDGNVLVETYASSPESWMTEEFIPFTSTLNFTALSGTKAQLELMLDNPAGPEEGFDRSVIIPVVIE